MSENTENMSKSKFSQNPIYWETLQHIRLVKACITGNGGVGKSNVIRLLKNLPYLKDYRPTYGVEFASQDYPENLRFQVWDMPGDDRFMKIAASYFKGAHIFIIVFDVTNRGSFEAI